MFAHEKVMFEIYREATYDKRFRVVYFTELDEHNKEIEIARAVAGDHFYDGYIKDRHLNEAKRAIATLLERLNKGEQVSPDEAASMLGVYQA